jgi:Transposase DDE domain
MTDARMNRRLANLLSIRLEEARLDEVRDDRDPRGKRWDLGVLLRAAIVGIASGAKSLADTEEVTASLSRAMRRKLGIARRVPDTTLRDNLCRVMPDLLVSSLHALVRAAHRRKALEPDKLPFGVASFDGKGTAIPSSDDWYAQRQTREEDGALLGVVRTVTVTLTSSQARPCIDVVAIPAHTNETGVFQAALAHAMRAYAGKDMFRVITYDAGACSVANAAAVRAHNLHYVFGLTAGQPTLFEEARRWLGSRSAHIADAITQDHDHGNTVIRRVYIGPATAAPEGWDHLRSVLRIETETVDASGNRLRIENRYVISSLAADRLTPAEWMLLIRRHWGVETTHQALDVAFEEDDHPWIEQNPRGTLVVAILRRIAYTLLALFRGVTQRSDERRATPWKRLLRPIHTALLVTTDAQLAGLRLRASSP